MPAYNAARTLERTYADIPQDLIDRIILVDDVSADETVDIARQLGQIGRQIVSATHLKFLKKIGRPI